MLLRTHENLKPYALAKVSLVMKKHDVGQRCAMPSELVELLAHELRWPEFKSLAEQRVQELFAGDRRLAVADLSDRVLRAMQENWEDREFYQRYKPG